LILLYRSNKNISNMYLYIPNNSRRDNLIRNDFELGVSTGAGAGAIYIYKLRIQITALFTIKNDFKLGMGTGNREQSYNNYKFGFQITALSGVSGEVGARGQMSAGKVINFWQIVLYLNMEQSIIQLRWW